MASAIRDRKFCAILYADDVSHMEAFSKIKENFDSAYILHDSDTLDTGEVKKPHYHVVFTFPNPRYLSSVADDLGIPENYVERCLKLNSALRYLIHADNPDKYQYSLECVGGTLKSKLEKLLGDVSEEAQVLQLINFLDSTPCKVTYRDFLVFACENGLYSCFRRLGYGMKLLLDSHNEGM